MEEQSKLGQWLGKRCKRGHLSLRQAAAKTGLSHSTIRDIIAGSRPLPETIKRLAQGFGGDGAAERMALENRLLMLAGYRVEHPEEELSEPLAQLMDKVRQFNKSQIKMMSRFADFLTEIEGK